MNWQTLTRYPWLVLLLARLYARVLLVRARLVRKTCQVWPRPDRS